MNDEIAAIKDKLIDELWFPFAKEGGDVFYRKRKKHKKMSFFTLTNDLNHREITDFIGKGLTEKDKIIAWTHSFQKMLRLETFTGCDVKGGSRFEDLNSSVSLPLTESFPFDIVNLDFSSQDPYSELGRVEKEIKVTEAAIRLQISKQTNEKGFILLFTTLIDEFSVSKELVLSNSLPVAGWAGLQLAEFQSPIVNLDDKIGLIERVLKQVISKYKCSTEKVDKRKCPLFDSTKVVASISGIVKKGG